MIIAEVNQWCFSHRLTADVCIVHVSCCKNRQAICRFFSKQDLFKAEWRSFGRWYQNSWILNWWDLGEGVYRRTYEKCYSLFGSKLHCGSTRSHVHWPFCTGLNTHQPVNMQFRCMHAHFWWLTQATWSCHSKGPWCRHQIQLCRQKCLVLVWNSIVHIRIIIIKIERE